MLIHHFKLIILIGMFVFYTENFGFAQQESWTFCGPDNTYINDIAIHPDSSNILYIAIKGSDQYLAKSVDGGISWSYFTDSPTNLYSIEIHPQDPSIIYIGNDLYSYKSVDSCKSWKKQLKSGVMVMDILVNPIEPKYVLWATTSPWEREYGIYWSDQYGWTNELRGAHRALALTVDLNNPDTVYAGFETGGYVGRSTDKGYTWYAYTPNGYWVDEVRDVEVNWRSDIYAATNDGLWKGVWVSDGLILTKLSGLPTDDITVLQIDLRVTPPVLYVGTWGYGVFYTNDDGVNWIPINTGLDNLYITSLSLSKSDPKILYAGTDNSGVWKYEIPTKAGPFILNPIPEQVVDEDFTTYIVADLDTVFDDMDSEILNYSVETDGNTFAKISGTLLNLSSVSDFYGTSEVILTATDEQPYSVNDTFLVNIKGINDSPAKFGLILPPDNDTLSNIDDQVDFSWHSSEDVDGDKLTYIWWISGGSLNMNSNPLQDTVFTFNSQGNFEYKTIYEWSAFVTDGFDTVASLDTFQLITPEVIDIEDQISFIPEKYALYQNHPNPFNTTTTIRYDLSEPTDVELSIFNLLGQKIVSLISMRQSAGIYSIEFDAANLSSGVYFYKLETDRGFIQTKKLLLLK